MTNYGLIATIMTPRLIERAAKTKTITIIHFGRVTALIIIAAKWKIGRNNEWVKFDPIQTDFV